MSEAGGGRGRGGSVARGEALGLWANRNFLCLWAAYGISAFGDHLSELGLWKLMGAGQSERQVQLQAAMTFVFFLPYLLFGAAAGVVADRVSRKWIMVVADLARAAVVGTILWWFGLATASGLGMGPTGAALLPLLVVGVFAAFFSPARIALLPRLVSDEQLTRANSLSNGLGVIAAMASVSVGGYLAAWSVGWNFRMDSLTFLCSAVLVSMIRAPRGRWESRQRAGLAGSLGEAVRYLRQHGRVRRLILVGALFWTAAAAFNCAVPPIVSHRYGLGIEALGLFRGAMGAGMVVGAVALSYFGEALRGDTVITWSLLGAAGMVVGFGVAGSAAWGAAFAIGAGICGVWLLIVVATLLQRIVPDFMRGRVFGISDLATVVGLLVATGALSVAPVARMDRWVVQILLVVAAGLAVAGAASMIETVRRSGVGFSLCFWRRVNEFYCRWFFRLRREGTCTIPRRGAVIVAANHTCSIDPLLILAASPHRLMGFLVGQEYYRLPVFGRLMRLIECIPTTRSGIDTAATKRALRHLAQQKALGIFPEGGLARPGEVRAARGGAALLALRSEAVVVPVHISGTRYSGSLVWPFFRRCRARVRFGRPIDFGADTGPSDRQTRGVAAERIMEQIRSLAPAAEVR